MRAFAVFACVSLTAVMTFAQSSKQIIKTGGNPSLPFSPAVKADGLIVVHPSDWIKSPNPYSYGIKTGNTLFLSGLISRNGKDNTTVKGDVSAQTKTVLDNGAAILKQAGMSFADVVSARVFLPDDTTF